jgi:glucose/arabinose dehydrogenase/mono/diheme cytochrome c family protein
LFIICCQQEKKTWLDSISTEPSDIRNGEHTFAQDCGPCHNFIQDGIGPNLAGVTREVPPDWIKRFVRNSAEVIDGGDERAGSLFDKYHVYMPPFGMYSDEKIDNLIAYLHTQEKTSQVDTAQDLGLINPIEEVVANSGITAEIQQYADIPFSSEEMPRTRIVKMDHIPGSERLFVADLRGQLYELIDQKPKLVLDLHQLFPKFIDKPGLATGFGSFAFHPDFQNNGLLYITHTEPPNSASADFYYDDSIKVTLQWILSECKIENPAKQPFEVSERELFRINVVTGIHGMQEIAFKPNIATDDTDYGKLFVNIGDGGAAENGYLFLADNPGTAWASILRIDPRGNNSKNGRYGIPEDNPFVGVSDALPEVFAYGFRNPHRTAWDHHGRMLATDIGHHRIEELNLILPGKNYGWPYREGTFVLHPQINMSAVFALSSNEGSKYTYPVAQYDHEEGNAISGGFEVAEDAIPQLKGKYIFGDIVRGRLFFIDLNEIELGKQAKVYEWYISVDEKNTDLMKLTGATRVDLRFGKDASDNVYIMTKADGKIYQFKTLNI